MIKKDFIAFLYALLACLIWSGSFVIARGVHDMITPVTLAFWRWLVATAIIIPIGYKQVRLEWPIIKKHSKYLIFMGALSVALFNTLVYIAAHYTSSHHIAIISSTAPIWTLLLVGIAGIEKLSLFKIAGAICAFFGALVIIAHGQLNMLLAQEWNRGDIILLLSAFIWAIYCVMLHYKPAKLHPKSFMTTIIIIGTLCLLPFYIIEARNTPTPFSLQAWAIYLYLGIGSSIIGWFTWNYAIHILGSVKTGLVYYTIPIFSSILAISILHEPIEFYHWIGFIFVFMGIILEPATLSVAKSFKDNNF